jgi:hypothetical protein
MQASVLRDLLECKQLLEKEVGREGPSLQRVADVLEMVERVSTSKTHGYTLMTVELLEQTKLGHLLNKRVRKLEGVGEGSVVAVLVKSLLAKWKKAAACGGFLATKKQEQATVRAPKASPTARSCHRYAITFGEQAILHVGGEEMGDGRRETGYSVTELQDIAVRINAAPATAEAVAPEAAAGGGSDPASGNRGQAACGGGHAPPCVAGVAARPSREPSCLPADPRRRGAADRPAGRSGPAFARAADD